MDLREYIFRKNTTYEILARKIGCSRNYLNAVGLKRYVPSKWFAKVVEMVTDGEVKIEDLLNPIKEENSDK